MHDPKGDMETCKTCKVSINKQIVIWKSCVQKNNNMEIIVLVVKNMPCHILLVTSRRVLKSKRQRQNKDSSDPNQHRLVLQVKLVEPKNQCSKTAPYFHYSSIYKADTLTHDNYL